MRYYYHDRDRIPFYLQIWVLLWHLWALVILWIAAEAMLAIPIWLTNLQYVTDSFRTYVVMYRLVLMSSTWLNSFGLGSSGCKLWVGRDFDWKVVLHVIVRVLWPGIFFRWIFCCVEVVFRLGYKEFSYTSRRSHNAHDVTIWLQQDRLFRVSRWCWVSAHGIVIFSDERNDED